MNSTLNKIKILTWNVNSIRVRIPLLLELIKKNGPDIMLLQETKCEDQKFPQEELSDLGYQIVLNGQKTYNGVAILSKFSIDSSTTTFTNNPIPEQARFLEAEISLPIGFAKIISVYVPNGGEVDSQNYKMKLEFLKALSEHLSESKKYDEYLIIGGDFNVAAEEIDVFDAERLSCQTCFTLSERKAMRALLNNGMCDLYRLVNADKKEFSWWDYRGSSLKKDEGMRIDTILSSYNLTKYSITTTILKEWRKCELPSDHAPVVVEIMMI
jgi:exodeoxyribonuclease III